ncbi:MAG TPA: hypothetical protein VKB78_17090, partial [Pirellulales bacterium]|nr:hypothetical protein [Pirellulales bacterium]
MSLSPTVRRLANRAGFFVMLSGAVLVLVATFDPDRWQIGPLTIKLRSVRNPAALAVLGYLLWRTTYDGFGGWLKRRIAKLEFQGDRVGDWLLAAARRFMVAWRSWKWRERATFVLVAAQVFFTLHFWQDYPAYLEFERQVIANSYRTVTYELNGRKLPVLESFSRRLAAELPEDARVLFHGQTAGLRLAYEIYPRPVFMLPQEMQLMAASWHVQPQLAELPADAKPDYWNRRLPEASVNEGQFVAEHRIT